MPLYLTNGWVQADAPFRGKNPVGVQHDARDSWVRLDQDRCLLWATSARSERGLVKLGDGRDEALSVAAKLALNNFVNDRDLGSQSSLKMAVWDILRRPPTGRWGGLRPSRRRRRYELVLGPKEDRIWHSEADPRVRPSTQSITDTFNRANGDLDGSTSSDSQFTWSEAQETGYTIASNQLQNITGAENFHVAVAEFDMDTDDHFVQIDIVDMQVGLGNPTVGIGVRMTDGTATTPGIFAEANQTSGRIYDFSDDSNISTSVSAFGDGDTIYFEIDGTTAQVKINGGNDDSATTSIHANETRTGIGIFGPDCLLDNFSAGDVGAAAAKKLAINALLHQHYRRFV